MSRRIGPGPVFVFESLIFARRWQVYAGRAVFVLAILGGLWGAWWSNLNGQVIGAPAGTRPGALQALAKAGQSFFYSLAGIQLAMVLLVAPAATAGAICHDRARGILAQMALTDLSDPEIVLGKLFSRLAPILGLLACALPVTALAALLGGIDFQALFSLFVVSVAVAVLGCSLALAVSVQVAKTHEALLAVLSLWTFWLMSLPIWSGMSTFNGVTPPPDWFKKANPFVLVYAPYSWPGYVGALDVALFVAGALALSAALAAGTIAGLRRALLPAEALRRGRLGPWLARRLPTLQSWSARIRGPLSRLPGPSLDGNPVLWREWHRNRPSRMTRILWGAYWLGAIAGIGIGIANAIEYGLGTPTGGFVLIASLTLQSFLGLLLLSGQAPTSLGEERVRGSLDVLMATPISTRAIVWGKWLGTYRITLWLAVLPGLAALIMACATPSLPAPIPVASGFPNYGRVTLVDRLATPALVVLEVLTYGAVITGLGLFLATWIARPGRAIALSVAAFVLAAVGWPFAFEMFILRPLQAWLVTNANISGAEGNWIFMGLISLSPLLGPAMTLDILDRPGMGDTRWLFHLVVLTWCLLAWAFAGALYGAVLRSFDRRLGRMREMSQSDGRGGPIRFDEPGSGEPALALSAAAASPDLAGCGEGRQNEAR
jgi:ABC-type transport system involved in multi-copper enzyme maturation permease subunit